MASRPLLFVVVVPLAVFFLAAGGTSVFASCGDWLAHAAPPQKVEPADELQSVNLSLIDLWQEADRELESDAPCNGPNCRRGAPLPASPEIPLHIVSVLETALLLSPSATRTFEPPVSFAVEIEARPAQGYPTRIEHPPRG